MKAYITFFKENKTREKVVWTIEEARKNLKEKDFEKLCSFEGIHNKRMIGYIA